MFPKYIIKTCHCVVVTIFSVCMIFFSFPSFFLCGCFPSSLISSFTSWELVACLFLSCNSEFPSSSFCWSRFQSSSFLSPPSLFHWPSATPRRPWWLVVGAWYKQLQHCQDTIACSVKLQLLIQYMCNAVFHLSEEEVDGKPGKPLLEDLRTSDVGLHQRLEHMIEDKRTCTSISQVISYLESLRFWSLKELPTDVSAWGDQPTHSSWSRCSW